MHELAAAQMDIQLLPECATRLNEKAHVDCLDRQFQDGAFWNRAFSQPPICCGDHYPESLPATNRTGMA